MDDAAVKESNYYIFCFNETSSVEIRFSLYFPFNFSYALDRWYRRIKMKDKETISI